MTNETRAIKPDAQAFDEVRIITAPRWKDSEMSGSEWRISGIVQLMRKGKIIHEQAFRDVKTACGFAYSEYCRAEDNGLGLFVGEGNICDQEGCHNEATTKLRLMSDFCKEGHESKSFSTRYRMFCDKHKKRGDCGLEDADRNYGP